MRNRGRNLLRKEDGSSIYILAMMFLMLTIVLLYFFFYQRSVEVIGNNLKSNVDLSNLSAANINLANYAEDAENFHIIDMDPSGAYEINGLTTGVMAGSAEYDAFMSRFSAYLDALRQNIGVSNSGFGGGACGWAANYLHAENFTVDTFAIYEPEKMADGTYFLSVYYVNNVTDIENPLPLVFRTRYTTNRVVVEGSEMVFKDPSVYSKVSFDIALPKDMFNQDNPQMKRVTTSAMCGVKKNPG